MAVFHKKQKFIIIKEEKRFNNKRIKLKFKIKLLNTILENWSSFIWKKFKRVKIKKIITMKRKKLK